jgi:hypothetical protein
VGGKVNDKMPQCQSSIYKKTNSFNLVKYDEDPDNFDINTD